MSDNSFKIAEVIVHLKNFDKYTTINKGDFKKVPLLEGYFINLSNFTNTNLYLIINKSKDYKVEDKIKKIDDIFFITLNVNKNFKLDKDNFNKILKNIIELLQELFSNYDILKNDEDENKEDDEFFRLPYGYTKNKEGNIIVHKEEANLVRKIFVLYEKYKSMRKVTDLLSGAGYKARDGSRIGFGTVSGILHDFRYLDKDLPATIVSRGTFYKAQQILKRKKVII